MGIQGPHNTPPSDEGPQQHPPPIFEERQSMAQMELSMCEPCCIVLRKCDYPQCLRSLYNPLCDKNNIFWSWETAPWLSIGPVRWHHVHKSMLKELKIFFITALLLCLFVSKTCTKCTVHSVWILCVTFKMENLDTSERPLTPISDLYNALFYFLKQWSRYVKNRSRKEPQRAFWCPSIAKDTTTLI